jgi:probable rRNA maturation factor
MTTPAHHVSITIDEAFTLLVAASDLEELALRVLGAEGLCSSELGVVVTDDETVRRLNREYAGEDHATDVLSFSLREGEEFAAPDEVARLGEVIISFPTAARQAAEAGRAEDDEVRHLLVHGILHLLGYDHLEPSEEAVMRSREEALLGMVHRHEAL